VELTELASLPDVPRVLEAGQGTAIVCSHGLSLDCELFRPQAEGLASEQLRVLAYDSRARGPRALDPYDLYDLADDFVAVLDSKSIDRAFLVGMSLGGAMAVRAALRYPERLLGVVLVGSSGGPYDAQGSKELEDLYASHRHERLLDAEFAEADANAHLSERSRRERPELAKFLRSRIAARGGEESFYEARSGARQDDVRERLPEVELPFLIVHGDEDVLVPIDMALETFSLLPRARLLVLPYAGHAVNLEEPRAVNDAIRAFVAETLSS
jgi:pimeloyl-ACP methyl ester carboxylesterase